MRFWIENAETVLIDRSALDGPPAAGPEADGQVLYRDFVEHVRSLLLPVFRPVATERRRGESVVIAESRLFEIGVAERAGDVGLSVAPRAGFATPDGFHPLAVANLHRAATAVWFRLLLHYPLRVRSGRWTTAAYDPVAEQAA